MVKKSILLMSKNQKELIKKLKDAEFDLSYKNAVDKIGMPMTSIWQSWKAICQNNEVKVILLINDEEYSRSVIKK
jgi:hypothetical protein